MLLCTPLPMTSRTGLRWGSFSLSRADLLSLEEPRANSSSSVKSYSSPSSRLRERLRPLRRSWPLEDDLDLDLLDERPRPRLDDLRLLERDLDLDLDLSRRPRDGVRSRRNPEDPPLDLSDLRSLLLLLLLPLASGAKAVLPEPPSPRDWSPPRT